MTVRFHVTPATNTPGILAHGLRVRPPARTFATGPRIYLADNPADARRWAAEIARALGGPVPIALLAVEVTGLTALGSDATEIGVRQWTISADVPADRISLVEEFTAVPAANPHRDGGAPPGQPGPWHCPRCGCEYRSRDGLDTHVGADHDDEDEDEDEDEEGKA